MAVRHEQHTQKWHVTLLSRTEIKNASISASLCGHVKKCCKLVYIQTFLHSTGAMRDIALVQEVYIHSSFRLVKIRPHIHAIHNMENSVIKAYLQTAILVKGQSLHHGY